MTTKWGDRDGRRRDILESGRRLLTQRGFAALQMRDVAEGAGISPGTVYTYYATKEALYATLYAERIDLFADTLGRLRHESDDPERLFVAIATEYRDMYSVFGRELNIWSVLAGATAATDAEFVTPLVASAGRCYQQMLQVARDQLSAIGAPESIDPALVVSLLWATITGLADQYTGVRRFLHEQHWEDTVTLAARTLFTGFRALAHD